MVKGRNFVSPSYLGTEYYGSSPIGVKTYTTNIDISTMWVGDRGHYGYPHYPADKDVGGAFYLEGVRTKRNVLPLGDIQRGNPNPLDQHYTGGLAVDIPHTGAWSSQAFPADPYGATAYNRMKPTKASFGTYNSLFETKDLPGMIADIPFRFWNTAVQNLQRAVRSFRDGGAGHFVGYEFGWKQLVQDVQNMCSLQQRGQKRLAWLLHNNNKPVHTAVTLVDTFDIVEDFAISGYGYLQPVLVTQYYAVEPHGRRLSTNREKVWAEGTYLYWLPDGPRDINWTNAMLASIYGQNVTAANLYKAVPWSWLLDWFTNVGTVLQNMDAGVAARLWSPRNYVMRKKEWTIQNTITGQFLDRASKSLFTATGSSSSTAFVKCRARGDPFGFATNQNTLSGMQQAIMGALGLSRLR